MQATKKEGGWKRGPDCAGLYTFRQALILLGVKKFASPAVDAARASAERLPFRASGLIKSSASEANLK